MRSPCLFVAGVLCLPVLANTQTNETIVPAGTLLQCTLDEPRFSSQTVQVGDPVLCHAHSLGMFGHPIFPRLPQETNHESQNLYVFISR
jgi:hypothetical protein